ncbi:hypothetical protein DEJ49_33675 [Streptomyces venezuelae]|uniref:Uncharacterized protein n=1 Tax=Streptomyces venezuelae TaxID=54571 RepID=A0A5P2CSL8_STRVZ|nr:hypothetical protein DEJ49_33675 [Streptomyces venezuelae]
MDSEWEKGSLVIDTVRQRLGRVMDSLGPGRVQLRPPGGGLEWDADADHVRAARGDEILRVASARPPAGRPS